MEAPHRGMVCGTSNRDAAEARMWILYLPVSLRPVVVNRNLRLQGVGQLKGVGVLGDYTANIFSALKVFNLSVVELGKTN